MMNFLYNLDLFGKNVSLRLNGSDQYKTGLGGLISLFNLCAIIGLVIFFGTELILKQNPNFIQENYYSPSRDNISLSNGNFFVAFRVSDYGETPDLVLNKYNNKSYFDIQISHEYTFAKKEKVDEKFLGLLSYSPCKQNETFIKKDIYEALLLDGFNCINFKNDTFIGGDGTWYGSTYFRIKVSRCNIDTEDMYGIKCAPSSEIDKLFDNVQLKTPFLQVRYSNDYIEATNFENPINKYIMKKDYPLQKLSGSYVVREHNKFYLKSDIAWEGENFVEKTGLWYARDQTTQTGSAIQYHIICDFIVSEYYTNYSRKYIKISAIVANIIGIMDCYFALLEYIIGTIADFSFNSFLINGLFMLEIGNKSQIETEENANVNNSNKEIIKIDNSPEKKNLNNFLELENKNDAADVTSERKFLNQNENERASDYIEMSNLKLYQKKACDSYPKFSKGRYKKPPNNIYCCVNLNKKSTDEESYEGQILTSKKAFRDPTEQKQRKLKKISYNKELKSLIENRTENWRKIRINFIDLIRVECCFICSNHNASEEKKLRNYLAVAANEHINFKLDVVNFLRLEDQFRLFNKLFLNKGQTIMLENREPHHISIKHTPGMFVEGEDDPVSKKLTDQGLYLKNYLDDKIQTNSMNIVDETLLAYLNKGYTIDI